MQSDKMLIKKSTRRTVRLPFITLNLEKNKQIEILIKKVRHETFIYIEAIQIIKC